MSILSEIKNQISQLPPEAKVAAGLVSAIAVYQLSSPKRRRLLNLRFRAARAEATAALQRRFGRTNRAPEPGDTTVSAEWLTKVLKDNGHLPKGKDSRAKSVTVEAFPGRGLTSDVVRLRVEYEGDQVPEAAPRTLVLKRNGGGFSHRLGFMAAGTGREGRLYHELAAEVGLGPLVPKTYYSSTSFDRLVVIMEDLQDGRTTPVNYFFGNQIWGVPDNLPTGLPDKLVVLEEMFLRAADLHAVRWNDRALLENKWLKSAPWYSGEDRASWELGMECGKRKWEHAKAKVKNGWVLSDELVAIIDKSYANSSWEQLQRHLHDPEIPFALVHGDFHASNMLWRLEKPQGFQGRFADTQLIWVDWSEVGVWEPAADLSQTIISDVRPEVWPHLKDLVHKYYARLEASVDQSGNKVHLGTFTFEKCWERFQQAGVERWIWMFCYLATMELPGKCIQYFHDQTLNFIKMHGNHPYYVLKPVPTLV
eukprot:TRINITY_DN1379_c0_g1_i2.p1 TRINITY_DN1379_c0_g1~~TRINITY_DN1379_c0_g1_i2.p1  ORF type:complete len:489 (+),score=59.97 TRINITY_DN1379_c0_g1_i2:33-1469(+)